MHATQFAAICQEFGGRPPGVQTAFCVNHRYKNAGCTLCVESCPTGAIEQNGSEPAIDTGACVRCGGCLSVCPTDTFSQSPETEDALLRTVGAMPAGELALVCTLHLEPATTSAPVSTVVRHKHCLAALGVEQLLTLCNRAGVRLWLDDSPCESCVLGATHAQLHRSVVAAKTILAATGRQADIMLLTEHAPIAPERRAPAAIADGSQPSMSRRALFALGRQRVAAAGRNSAETTAPASESDVPAAERLPHRVPPSRQRLLEWCADMPPTTDVQLSTDVIPFATVEVDGNACSACGLCSRFCPTGALEFVGDADAFSLNFKPSLCVDCGICAKACPADAIRFGGQLDVSSLITASAIQVAAGALTACAVCAQPTAAHPDSQGKALCYACAPSKRTSPPRPDIRKALFDRLAET